MFRNTLCEAEPDEPGERSAFGAIRTGIELCERQPRQSSGSIGQPDLAPNAMPDTVLIVPAAGMRRIVAQRADIEIGVQFFPAEFADSGHPGRTGVTGIVRTVADRIRPAPPAQATGRIRFRPRTKTRCGPHRTTTGCLYPRCRYRRPATGRRSPTTCPHRKVAPYRATTADRTRRTSRRGRSPRPCRGFSHRYCRSADTQMRTPRNPSTSFHGPSARSQTILNGA